MPARRRLDAELVRRGFARSREQAARLIAAERVKVSGRIAVKPATVVSAADPIVVTDEQTGGGYVSRGGDKLAAALDSFAADGLTVAGRHCLDAGASTGGFTDVLLRRGASHVVVVDVGYGQLAWPLRQDDRVTVLERTNVRDLTPELVGDPVQLVVADLSFISLTLVLGPLVACAKPDADFVLLVKPQFEVGREQVGKGGVVREPGLRTAAVRAVAAAAEHRGLGVAGLTASPLPGPSGNVEYFLWLRAGAPPLAPEAADRAVEEGPQ
ncbi:MAG: TlyA family RNA methyltransferase [bacterium]